jgi:hypothetical protein
MKTLFIIQGGNVAYRKSLIEGQQAIMTKEMSGLIHVEIHNMEQMPQVGYPEKETVFSTTEACTMYVQEEKIPQQN